MKEATAARWKAPGGRVRHRLVIVAGQRTQRALCGLYVATGAIGWMYRETDEGTECAGCRRRANEGC
jgi:hypothetical protein